MNILEFRRATIKDIEGIINLCNECFKENTNIENAKKIYIKTKEDKNQIYIIGTINKNIVAHAKISIITTIYENIGTYAILNHVCVKPSLRRKQIATKMLDECFVIARAYNCRTVQLWSNNFRNDVHIFYKKYGFNEVDDKHFIKYIN